MESSAHEWRTRAIVATTPADDVRLLRYLLFRLGADTRTRNRDVARTLAPVLSRDIVLLDAGSGQYGLGDFVRPARVVRTDVHLAPGDHRGVCATVTALPFLSSSVPVSACVDVLEHLPPAAREAAIAELVRVTRTALVVASPSGPQARQVDERFQTMLAARRTAEPPWLTEHLQHPYPSVETTVSLIKAACAAHRREIDTIAVRHSEPLGLTRILRWTAARSTAIYAAVNLLAGVLLPMLPAPRSGDGYRAIVLVTFR